MQPFLLPPCLGAISPVEKNQLYSLPWKLSNFSTLPSGSYTFILLQGVLLEKDNEKLSFPNEDLLGIIPFTKQKKSKYKEKHKAQIAFIDSKILAQYILSKPGLYRSYIQMQHHLGRKLLPQSSNPAAVYSVTSNNSIAESFHFAMALAIKKAKNSKVVYLELQREIQSVFSYLEMPSPTAIIDSTKDASLLDLIKNNSISFTDKIHLLNVQYLSISEIDESFWAAIYHHLGAQYQTIIVHQGDYQSTFITDSSSLSFHFKRENENRANVNDTHSPVFEITTKQTAGIRLDSYPISYNDEELPPFATELESHDNYWQWFDEAFTAILSEHSYIIGDSFNNPEGMSALMHAILVVDQGANLEDQSIQLFKLFKNRLIVLHGISTIIGLLASSKVDFKEFKAILSRLHKKNFLSKFKPVFPSSGVYAKKPIVQYLKAIFGKDTLQQHRVFFAQSDKNSEYVRWLSSGYITDSILEAAFKPGVINNKDDQKYFKINATDYDKEIASAFRYGFKQLTFFIFANRKSSSTDVTENLLLDNSQPNIINGKNVRVVIIDNPDIEDFWEKENAIAHELSKIL